MEAVGAHLGQAWSLAAACLLACVLAAAARLARWQSFLESGRVHRFLGGAMCVAFLWVVRAEPAAGVSFRFLGAPLLTLLLGPSLALCSIAVGAMFTWLSTDHTWAAAVWALLFYGALPVILTDLLRRAVAQWLPANIFIYLLGAGFATAGLVEILTQVAVGGLVVWSGVQPAGTMFGQYMPFLMLIGFGEATLTGMILTLLVVYLPHWVATFEDAHYLERGG